MPPLEAQYDGASGAPVMPYVEAMLIMELCGRRRRCGIAALAHRKVPRRLTAIVRSQASMSSSWRRCEPPEMRVVDQHVELPEVGDGTVDQGGDLFGIGDVA